MDESAVELVREFSRRHVEARLVKALTQVKLVGRWAWRRAPAFRVRACACVCLSVRACGCVRKHMRVRACEFVRDGACGYV